jgi:hypothetical protein
MKDEYSWKGIRLGDSATIYREIVCFPSHFKIVTKVLVLLHKGLQAKMAMLANNKSHIQVHLFIVRYYYLSNVPWLIIWCWFIFTKMISQTHWFLLERLLEDDLAKKYHLVNWETVHKAKNPRGLGHWCWGTEYLFPWKLGNSEGICIW